MSLPAGQQRVIDKVEGTLRTGEPHLESMFAMFARLNEGEPVAAELLAGTRRRWLRPGNGMYALVLVPVMFAALIAGALLGGSARTAGTCEAGYSVGGVSPLASRTSCATQAKPAAGYLPAACFTAIIGGDQVFFPPGRADKAMCYK